MNHKPEISDDGLLLDIWSTNTKGARVHPYLFAKRGMTGQRTFDVSISGGSDEYRGVSLDELIDLFARGVFERGAQLRMRPVDGPVKGGGFAPLKGTISRGFQELIRQRRDDLSLIEQGGVPKAQTKPLAILETEERKDAERLPVEELRKVTAEHIWNSVQRLLGGYTDHGFGESTDFDVLAENEVRLAPTAVFGVAATEALGFEVLPKHFSAGIGSPCFRILEQAGFAPVPKGPEFGDSPDDLAPIHPWIGDVEFLEGAPKLRRHLYRERAPGLRQAKLAHFRHRNEGRLFCERCHLDPFKRYAHEVAEACIEVHHSRVHVQMMEAAHKTALEDLQCLCANCHRVVHRELRQA